MSKPLLRLLAVFFILLIQVALAEEATPPTEAEAQEELEVAEKESAVQNPPPEAPQILPPPYLATPEAIQEINPLRLTVSIAYGEPFPARFAAIFSILVVHRVYATIFLGHAEKGVVYGFGGRYRFLKSGVSPVGGLYLSQGPKATYNYYSSYGSSSYGSSSSSKRALILCHTMGVEIPLGNNTHLTPAIQFAITNPYSNENNFTPSLSAGINF